MAFLTQNTASFCKKLIIIFFSRITPIVFAETWAKSLKIVYLGMLIWKWQKKPKFWATSSHSKSNGLYKNWVWIHFGRVFYKLIWSPCSHCSQTYSHMDNVLIRLNLDLRFQRDRRSLFMLEVFGGKKKGLFPLAQKPS
jgi:hypothetical protein